jgi:hypothetical protein
MHKFFLIAAMVLASASAQAAGSTSSRSLTLASNEEPVAAEQGTSEAPKYVARPSATTEQPKSDEAKPAAKTAATPRAEKPRRRGASTEARVIYELHRHGIYW